MSGPLCSGWLIRTNVSIGDLGSLDLKPTVCSRYSSPLVSRWFRTHHYPRWISWTTNSSQLAMASFHDSCWLTIGTRFHQVWWVSVIFNPVKYVWTHHWRNAFDVWLYMVLENAVGSAWAWEWSPVLRNLYSWLVWIRCIHPVRFSNRTNWWMLNTVNSWSIWRDRYSQFVNLLFLQTNPIRNLNQISSLHIAFVLTNDDLNELFGSRADWSWHCAKPSKIRNG